ncbi:pimeloyl-ACP methyl ester carboxylesterase [Geodermatophilus bullaregiensis]|uniref:alpha/beta fold hydrolase n=1 Tax=Geodermatophilus bullaregiensis TaxID=1564160 RepID=UPI0019574CCE|nr:alpha/beta hydrolase [Geodermatophilus bullaregiensis]MBM7805286.1 pimeloyl-ACP methyl ester carboxylesterase [Geodermatophilus bullaregiensis]
MDTTFLLVPGAGGRAWYWHRLVPELERRGHRAVAVDLPAGDDAAGLRTYTDVALAALGSAGADGGAVDGDVVVLGQSMGGLTAPLVAARRPVRLLVLLNAMVPRPGETGGQWWEAVDQAGARAACARAQGRPEDDDVGSDFSHDVPAEVWAAGAAHAGEQSGTPFTEPWPLAAWPAVPTRVLAGRDDRFFPPALQRRVARERLGLDVEEVPGGHLAALSRPAELAAALDACLRETRHTSGRGDSGARNGAGWSIAARAGNGAEMAAEEN